MDGFDRQFQELLAELDQLVLLLSKHGESRWVDGLAKDRQSLAHFDAKALDHLLSAFGGMGSLNDLIIHPANGHVVEVESIDEVNDELSTLRSAVYRLTIALRRSLDW